MTEICDVQQRRARKQHSCDVCGAAILPGSEYISFRSMQDGRFWYNKSHIHCDAILNAYIRENGMELGWNELDCVQDWIRDEVCSACSERSGGCMYFMGRLYCCERVIRQLVQPTVLHAALASAAAVKEGE